MTAFSAAVFQTAFMPASATEVNAVVTVTATGGAAAAPSEKIVVLVVDCSGSMGAPDTKIRGARKAAASALSMLPDGTLFALVAGTEVAQCVYPPTPPRTVPQLARADETTRGAAIAVARQLQSGGGTRISSWIDIVRVLVEPLPQAIRLAYLMTDGKDEGEQPADLMGALTRATGAFQCDCRGVGTDWNVAELRAISSALLGEVDIIKEAGEMEADFQAFLERAIGKTVAAVNLRIWTPKGSVVRFVKQVAPSIEDLTAKATQVNELTRDYPTGAWAGDESRDYHVCVDVPAGSVGDEKLAARVTLMVGDEQASQALVRAVWTDDDALSTRINPQVAHYTGQAELADAIQEGLAARAAGDLDTATMKLGRAVQLAAQSGNDGTMKLLRKVVEVENEETGTVKVKRSVEAADEMELDTRSTRTVRVNKAPAADAPAAAPEEAK
jgi:hypothetical protein